MKVKDRILDNVTFAPNGCMLWMGSLVRDYGVMQIDKTRRYVHRVYYEIVKGTIPEGLELDHLCRVKRCCNPQHLEIVTHAQNIRRCPTVGRPKQKYCRKGFHLMKDGYIDFDGGRHCAECKKLAYERKRDEKH